MAKPSGIDDDGEDHEVEVESDGDVGLQQEPAAGEEVEGFVMMGGNLLSSVPVPPKLPPDPNRKITRSM